MRRASWVVLVLVLAGCGSKATLAASSGEVRSTGSTSTTTTTAVPLRDLVVVVANDDGTADLYALDGTRLGRRHQSEIPATPNTDASDSSEPPEQATDPEGRAHGHWFAKWVSPDGRTRLGGWSGECESPSAWFSTDGGAWRPVVDQGTGWPPESVALGWAPDGRAVVTFTEGICGTGIGRAGTYLVTIDGTPELILSRQAYWLWAT